MNKRFKWDPFIASFQHCGRKVFCFERRHVGLRFPQTCPLCDEGVQRYSMPLERLRGYPFIEAYGFPCAVFIKPTIGNFLNDYHKSMDFHIGVTTSDKRVVEFDQLGLRTSQWPRYGCANHWKQCLLIYQVPESMREHWDTTLSQMIKQKCWSAKAYNKDNHNCYSFVLTFLVRLGYGKLSEAASNKTLFCEKFIAPRTTAVVKYISLFKKIKEHGYYVQRKK